MEFEKDRSAGYLANHLARLFARHLHARIKPLGLSPGTFPVLLELWREEGLTQRQLVERLDIEQATMANTLSRMERDGLIVRTRDEADARVQRVRLTPRAKALETAALGAAEAVNRTALGDLDEPQRAALIGHMQRMITALQAAPPGISPTGAPETGGPETGAPEATANEAATNQTAAKTMSAAGPEAGAGPEADPEAAKRAAPPPTGDLAIATKPTRGGA
ncbi:DNA-binding MarR family transcriptional regulator [Rhodothalassium salexigens DSM 2132]|uniref:DNA-binding MarR family transcriptional regulator n=1 Tax=Rhodothalassium salexigens DSM 2132 TaxID=1188247 RepID=A0A4R2PT88_RHOSA|nr:MarR family winged helix-turn-helix transcriptional regulator [Rhodothalassium salexigens]MBB4210053.1 DNA-binding MarR family transcriptional regulator [Rhodothalassium salexigens DSM 2132]MBK1637577.1 hypothetical protein [Rhodothalassium salexigens DSM 2132]TCP38218.1 DNA-binding MarR family transcriptional regulator [Rhodothalassium salexigens DSM 2132]